MVIPVALQLAVLASASIQPASVPARGEQEALLTLDKAGMVRLAATSGAGTACTVVDHLRGPFASAGDVGVKDCELDLLLDPGTYKIRLASPAAGKGTVKLQATAFHEVNPAPVKLEKGRAVEGPLRSGQQASFWLHLEARSPVSLRASGRTAGALQLWRAGAWREDLSPRDAGPSPRPGQPIHEWWIEETLEAGDYLVTVYGTGERRWTEGVESDLLSVQWGFAPMKDQLAAVTLPAWGLATFEVPGGPGTGVLTVSGSPATQTRLAVSEARLAAETASCAVEPKALVPECVATAWRDAPARVLSVRGAPGTQVELRWAPRGKSARLVDGEYRQNALEVPVEHVPGGEYLLGLRDVPPDRDAAPLACALVHELPKSRRETVAVDFPAVGPGKPLHRAFSTTGDQTIWFEVATAGTYRISTDPKRKERCELYRVEADKATRLTRTAEKAACDVRQQLGAGRYELRLSGGGRGIDRVLVAAEGGPASPPDSAPRTGCFLRAKLLGGDETYTLLSNRTGAAAVRGLVARPLPLTLSAPLPFVVQAGETERLPVHVNGTIRVSVSSAAGKPATCALAKGGAGAWRDGACWVTAKGADELVLAAAADAPLSVSIAVPPAPAPAAAPLQAFSPSLIPIPPLQRDQPAFFDLGDGASRSFVFQVAAAGLYHVHTEGLLATECTLRTPTVARLASDRGGGRGRNCLVETYLDPGQYLVTARAVGASRGRASMVLEQRAAKDLGRVAADAEVFFRAPAGELVRQRLVVPQAGRFALATTALGAAVRCRLEDAEGWPLVAVPTPCATELALAKGEYLWTQLPLTVESMRHTVLTPVRPAVVLRGEAPHAVELWTRYPVELSQKGRDEFRFTLQADLDVYVELTGGMQGRILREGEENAIEVIPPIDAGEEATPAGYDEDAGATTEESAEGEPAPEGEYKGDGEGEGEYAEGMEGEGEEGGEGESDEPAPQRASRPAPRVAPAPVDPSRPPGFKVALPAGKYRLVTEHSRGDVAISYTLLLATETLTPGMARDLPVPSRVPVRLARAGTLRLRTRGDADVRCRMFDGAGRLVAESSELGDDWNCGMAEPLAAGDYTLVLESETQLPGTTRLALSAPPTVDAGPLETGKRLTAGERVLSAALPAPADDVVQVALEAKDPFSCAIEGDAGAILFSRTETRSCKVLLHPRDRAWRLRLWTLERSAEVVATVKLKPVVALSGGRVAEANAARAEIARPGLYRTGEHVSCLPAGTAGRLEPCGPEVPLAAGPVLLASSAAEAQVSLEEVVLALDTPRPERRALTRRPFLQRMTSKEKAIHLLEARAAPGERAAPLCELEGGARAPGLAAVPGCFAASSPATSSVAQVFVPADGPVDVDLVRTALPLPRSAGRLEPGHHALPLAAAGGRWSLPEGPARVELLLPPAAWAVLLAGDRTVSLCAPAGELSRCTLEAQGGELVLHAPKERRAEADVFTLPAAAREVALASGPFEARPAPGALALRAAAAERARLLEISGAARCFVRLSDGTRLADCAGPLPPGRSAEIVVDAGGPLRVVARPVDSGPAAIFARALGATPPALRPGEAAALAGALVERSFTVSQPSVVHLRADAGVCALAAGPEIVAVEGLGAGCAVDRLLPAGTHRLAVRPFGDEPLAGVVRFTAEPVETLAEGVGAERWLSPGQARVFQFQAAAKGRVGVGLQEEAEVLSCAVLDGAQRRLATGCQALLDLDAGAYLLEVRAPAGGRPVRFRPVVLGLAGTKLSVPDDYLRDLFQRIGAKP